MLAIQTRDFLKRDGSTGGGFDLSRCDAEEKLPGDLMRDRDVHPALR